MDSTTAVEDVALPAMSSGPRLGARYGRFIVLSGIGSGAMGVVMAAYDPELDRKVAIKVLRAEVADQAAHARLVREAQALARLNHPNVVAIHEVGSEEGRVFVAMEFVQGRTLRAWMEEQARDWRAVIEVFAAAGRGLAAAHAVGLVHRDFKPDNVMIGEDGRVRVMDFGLARADESTDAPQTEMFVGDASGASLALARSPSWSRLTRVGTLLGTPAYMAPEQWRREEATARSDQWSFCVALFEALLGARPFAGVTGKELARIISLGKISWPAGARAVPGWVRRLVARGLSVDPEARHASMDALLDALLADPARHRRRAALSLGFVGMLGALIWTTSSLLDHAGATAARPCTDMADKLDGVWDDARRRELATLVRADSSSQSEEDWSRLERDIDAYAKVWVDARVEACEATMRGEQSGELLDRRMACLDARLVRFAATLELLREGDAAMLRSAVDALAGLPRIELCADTERLMAERAPPDMPELAAALARVDEQLAAASAAASLGQIERAATLADAAVGDALAIGDGPLVVRAWLVEAKVRLEQDELAGAREAYSNAYFDALAHRMPQEAAYASSTLLYLLSIELVDLDAAEAWVPHAEAASRAAGDEARASFAGELGRLRFQQGDLAKAGELFELQRSLLEPLDGPEHPRMVNIYIALGRVALERSQLDEARRDFEHALAIRLAQVGEQHPSLIPIHNSLGQVARKQGRISDALAIMRRALALSQATHSWTAVTMDTLGLTELEAGELATAREHLEQAQGLHEQSVGKQHPRLAVGLMGLGRIDVAEGRLASARTHFERALAILEQTQGPEHPELVPNLCTLAEVALAEGDRRTAREYVERALDIARKAGPEAIDLACPLAR